MCHDEEQIHHGDIRKDRVCYEDMEGKELEQFMYCGQRWKWRYSGDKCALVFIKSHPISDTLDASLQKAIKKKKKRRKRRRRRRGHKYQTESVMKSHTIKRWKEHSRPGESVRYQDHHPYFTPGNVWRTGIKQMEYVVEVTFFLT
ncbi:hypothetical protein STEG23_026439 [Scotinomys teguina]